MNKLSEHVLARLHDACPFAYQDGKAYPHSALSTSLSTAALGDSLGSPREEKHRTFDSFKAPSRLDATTDEVLVA